MSATLAAFRPLVEVVTRMTPIDYRLVLVQIVIALGFYIPTLGLVHRAARRMGWTEPFALTVGTVVGALYWVAFLIRSVGSARAPMVAMLAAGVTFPLFLLTLRCARIRRILDVKVPEE